jgi:hypothetical protein
LLEIPRTVQQTHHEQRLGEAGRREHGVGVGFAKYASATGKGILLQFPCRVVLLKPAQIDGKVVGAAEGIGMIIADDGPVPAECVLVDPACLGIVTEGVLGHPQMVGRMQGMRVILSQDSPIAFESLGLQFSGASVFTK